MTQMLKVGIIGTGRAGRCHATAFSQIPGVSVTALWNRTRSRAEQLAIDLGGTNVEVYENWDNLIEDSQVDIISITAAPVVRLAPFAKALARGRHVLVEKPLSIGLDEAHKMAELAERSQTITAISFNWRYSPACQTAWNTIRKGQIGKPLDIRTEWRMRYSPLWSSLPPWSELTGTLREAGSHEFDRVRFLTGWEFKKVVSQIKMSEKFPGKTSDETSSTHDMFASVLAEMTDGSMGAFRLTITPGQPERQVTICGDKGTVTFNTEWTISYPAGRNQPALTLGSELKVFRQQVGEDYPVLLKVMDRDQQPPGSPSGQHTWNRLISDFVKAVHTSDVKHLLVPHLPHVSDGLAVQEMVVACERSHSEQCWVTMRP